MISLAPREGPSGKAGGAEEESTSDLGNAICGRPLELAPLLIPPLGIALLAQEVLRHLKVLARATY
jgi:hypothetical protein